MHQYRYILFKDGSPWKGLFSELDFMNEYDHVFDKLLEETMDWICPEELAKEVAIEKFFKEYCPVTWDYANKCYRSLFEDYILGEDENSGSIVYGIDYETMNRKEKALFNFFNDEHNELLEDLNKRKKFDKPVFGVSRGTGALTTL